MDGPTPDRADRPDHAPSVSVPGAIVGGGLGLLLGTLLLVYLLGALQVYLNDMQSILIPVAASLLGAGVGGGIRPSYVSFPRAAVGGGLGLVLGALLVYLNFHQMQSVMIPVAASLLGAVVGAVRTPWGRRGPVGAWIGAGVLGALVGAVTGSLRSRALGLGDRIGAAGLVVYLGAWAAALGAVLGGLVSPALGGRGDCVAGAAVGAKVAAAGGLFVGGALFLMIAMTLGGLNPAVGALGGAILIGLLILAVWSLF